MVYPNQFTHHKPEIGAIIKEERSIKADRASRLSWFFGNIANFSLGLQNGCDLELEQNNLKVELAQIETIE